MPDSAPVQSPQRAAKQRAKRYLPPVIGLAVLIAITLSLHAALAKISGSKILAAIAATPRQELVHATLLTGASLLLMAIYDVPGILFARKLSNLPHLTPGQIALASSCAYALSHVLGAPALSGAAIRVRLYAQWNIPPAGIARIATLSGVNFALGAAALLGAILLFHPQDIPLFGKNLPIIALRLAGATLWLIPGAYIAAAGAKTPLTIFGKSFPRPGPLIATTQILLSCTDTAIACAILYTILPTVPGLTYAHTLGIYLAAFAIGLISALPGGVGVVDSLLLLGLTPTINAAPALAAILLFRILYYLIPALIAAFAFFGHELYVTLAKPKHKKLTKIHK